MKVGDLVTLRSGLHGIIVNFDEVKAKNIIGRAGKVEIIEVLTEKYQIARVLLYQLEKRKGL